MKKHLFVILFFLVSGLAAAADKTVTVKPTGGDYTSLNAALAGESADLVTNTCKLTIECYSMEDSQAATTGTGYTVSASYYINITVPLTERHLGKWDDSKYSLRATVPTVYVFQNFERYTRLIGVQLLYTSNNGGTYYHISDTSAGNFIVDSCIIRGIFTGTAASHIGFYLENTYPSYIINTIFQDIKNGAYDQFYAIRLTNAGTSLRVYSSTIYNCYYGINRIDGTILAKNVGVAGCNTAFSGTITQTTCSSSTPTFVSTSGTYDLHLATGDTTWQDQGTDTSGDAAPANFTTDIDGETRSGSWDIGSDEYSITYGGGGGSPAPGTNKYIIISDQCGGELCLRF